VFVAYQADFVGSLARQYDLDYFPITWPPIDPTTSELTAKSNFQQAARNWRRTESQRILDTISNSNGKYIATAHHREDQLETILLKLLRGTFISNIHGVSL
jgi:tRNA(Ile)-lysidine synthase TilS/MesJ